MDVRDAADLTPEQFYREYVGPGIPVVIRHHGAATSFARRWDVARLAHHCGRVVKVEI